MFLSSDSECVLHGVFSFHNMAAAFLRDTLCGVSVSLMGKFLMDKYILVVYGFFFLMIPFCNIR